MTDPRTLLAAILQDAYTAGYAAPAFAIRNTEDGLAAIQAAVADGAPLALVLNIADFPAERWSDVCAQLNESAHAAYGQDFALVLVLEGLADPAQAKQAAEVGFAMCFATASGDTSAAIVEAGMMALRELPLGAADRSLPAPNEVLAVDTGSMPELHDLVRVTSVLPGVFLTLRPGQSLLEQAEEPADATFFPGREHPLRAAVRTGVCLVLFDTDGGPTPAQVEEAVRLTASQGAARFMEHSS